MARYDTFGKQQTVVSQHGTRSNCCWSQLSEVGGHRCGFHATLGSLRRGKESSRVVATLHLTGLLFGAYFYLAYNPSSVLKSFSAQRMTRSFFRNVRGNSVIAVKSLHYFGDCLLIRITEVYLPVMGSTSVM